MTSCVRLVYVGDPIIDLSMRNRGACIMGPICTNRSHGAYVPSSVREDAPTTASMPLHQAVETPFPTARSMARVSHDTYARDTPLAAVALMARIRASIDAESHAMKTHGDGCAVVTSVTTSYSASTPNVFETFGCLRLVRKELHRMGYGVTFLRGQKPVSISFDDARHAHYVICHAVDTVNVSWSDAIEEIANCVIL